jgi:hypothetical protein
LSQSYSSLHLYTFDGIFIEQLNIFFLGAVVAVIAWLMDLQLPMQSVPITTGVVSSNLDQG